MNEEEMKQLERVFVNKSECAKNRAEINQKNADTNLLVGKVATKLNIIAWLLGGIFTSIIGAVITVLVAKIL